MMGDEWNVVESARLQVFNSEYVPGTPITINLLEALLVRVVGEWVGLLSGGWSHVGIEYTTTNDGPLFTDLCGDGAYSYRVHELVDPPWTTKVLEVELDPEKLASPCDLVPESFWNMHGNKVTTRALLKRALRIPLGPNDYICTDFVQYHLDPGCFHPQDHNKVGDCHAFDHWTPFKAVMFATRNNMITWNKESDEPCPISCITLPVKNVRRPTMLQFMFMGAVTALGVGHIIAKAPSTW